MSLWNITLLYFIIISFVICLICVVISLQVDYYRQSGSKWWLNKIRVPTIAINARDDPFIEERSLPTAADVGEEAPVRLIYHDKGGHCGFYATVSGDKSEGAALEVKPHGWLAEELSRAVHHMHVNVNANSGDAANSRIEK